MNILKSISWNQLFFYGFVFILGFFFQPQWFYNNFYSLELWQNKAWMPNQFLAFSFLSGTMTCISVWLFARLAKKIL